MRRGDSSEPGTLVGIAMDVTEQRLVQQSLHQFFLLAQDLLAVVSFDGHFLEVNDAFTKLLGWSREQLCSRHNCWFGCQYSGGISIAKSTLN